MAISGVGGTILDLTVFNNPVAKTSFWGKVLEVVVAMQFQLHVFFEETHYLGSGWK